MLTGADPVSRGQARGRTAGPQSSWTGVTRPLPRRSCPRSLLRTVGRRPHSRRPIRFTPRLGPADGRCCPRRLPRLHRYCGARAVARRRAFRLIPVDHRGHGASPLPRAPTGWPTWPVTSSPWTRWRCAGAGAGGRWRHCRHLLRPSPRSGSPVAALLHVVVLPGKNAVSVPITLSPTRDVAVAGRVSNVFTADVRGAPEVRRGTRWSPAPRTRLPGFCQAVYAGTTWDLARRDHRADPVIAARRTRPSPTAPRTSSPHPGPTGCVDAAPGRSERPDHHRADRHAQPVM